MRQREQVLNSLEKVFLEAFRKAEEADDAEAMERLNLEYQRDQLRLEVLLDIRELLDPADDPPPATERAASLIEQAEKLRRITRLR